jgi:hypothetical protein
MNNTIDKDPFLIIRALINDKLGLILLKISGDDILITLEYPTNIDDNKNNNIINEYMYDYSLKTTKLKEVMNCICQFQEVIPKISDFKLKFFIESEEKIKYTNEEVLNMPINRVPHGMRAKLYPVKE